MNVDEGAAAAANRLSIFGESDEAILGKQQAALDLESTMMAPPELHLWLGELSASGWLRGLIEGAVASVVCASASRRSRWRMSWGINHRICGMPFRTQGRMAFLRS